MTNPMAPPCWRPCGNDYQRVLHPRSNDERVDLAQPVTLRVVAWALASTSLSRRYSSGKTPGKKASPE